MLVNRGCLIDPSEFKHFDVYFLFHFHGSTPALRPVNRISLADFKVGNAEYLLQFFDLALEKVLCFLHIVAVVHALTVEADVRGCTELADFFEFALHALSRVTVLTEVGLSYS